MAAAEAELRLFDGDFTGEYPDDMALRSTAPALTEEELAGFEGVMTRLEPLLVPNLSLKDLASNLPPGTVVDTYTALHLNEEEKRKLHMLCFREDRRLKQLWLDTGRLPDTEPFENGVKALLNPVVKAVVKSTAQSKSTDPHRAHRLQSL